MNKFLYTLSINNYYEYLPLLHIILKNTLRMASVVPNGIFVASLRDFLKYMRCSIILEGCNDY